MDIPTKVLCTRPMKLYAPHFSHRKFITFLRNYFVDGNSDVHEGTQIKLVGNMAVTFVDVKVMLDETYFLIVRFRTSDGYFIAYAKGMNGIVTRRWFALKEGNNAPMDIRTEEERGQNWVQTNLGFNGSYNRAGIGEAGIAGMVVSRQNVIENLRGLYYYDPEDTPDNYMQGKRGCLVISTTIAEPMRFWVLQSLIHISWRGIGHTFTVVDKKLMKSLGNVSAYLAGQDPTEVEMKWLNEVNREDLDQETGKIFDRLTTRQRWRKVFINYGIPLFQFNRLCAMLKMEEDDQ